MKKEYMFIVILLLILLALVFIYRNKSTYDFKIYFFDAGKADAIVLSKNNKYMMIDTGEEDLSEEILSYFKNNNITKLDYLIITHFDKDHVGSASSILENVEVGEVLQSNVPKESEYYDNYISSLSNKNITPKTITGDYELQIDTLEVVVNGPDKVYDSNESNNSSLIVSIKDGNNRFLFMGDAQNARINDFLSINDETYDFLKVPYHGNYLKRLDDLLDSKNISYAVITSSNKELESDETIELLDEYNVLYYLTRNGSVTVLSNGTNILIKQ